jgi:hypothetical protein
MGIQVDFISSESLRSKGSVEKINMILEKIKNNVIVVLEDGLTPVEETELIEATMREIDTEDFHGIEFYRMDHKTTRLRDKIADYISGRKSGLTIVGSARIVEAIRKEPDYISMLAKLEEESSEKKKKRKSKKKGVK